jgi:acyl carrier protein
MTTTKTALVTALIASVLDLPEGSVNSDASMETLPSWDSLGQLNICLAFQERFGVDLDMQTIASSTSVSQLTALLPN